MKLAIVGSRTLQINDLQKYIPDNVTEIVSGGAKGIDSCAREFALANGIRYTEFLPDYKKYGRAAPLVRNRKIVEYCNEVIAFWNGESKGTRNIIDYCSKHKIEIRIINITDDNK